MIVWLEKALVMAIHDRQLADFICDVMSTRLDHSMPLWRAYYVEGTAGIDYFYMTGGDQTLRGGMGAWRSAGEPVR